MIRLRVLQYSGLGLRPCLGLQGSFESQLAVFDPILSLQAAGVKKCD
jgi:hypothetical protein